MGSSSYGVADQDMGPVLSAFPDGIVKDGFCEEIQQVNDAATQGASPRTKREVEKQASVLCRNSFVSRSTKRTAIDWY